jgi:hypothetical protein
MATNQPGWARRYRLGVELNKHMTHRATLQEVADALGITKQNAYTETCLALGTLIYRLRERLGLPAEIDMIETPEIAPHTYFDMEMM